VSGDDGWDKLPGRTFDLLVVGGGIHGAAIARDAAMRGMSVLLVERKDWGWATSAKSSRLAHGGLRYLEQFEFGLVHEALQDRERYLRHAPHHVHPLRFLYPLYPHVASRRLVRVGLALYDVLSHGRSVPGHERLRAKQALEAEPGLQPAGLLGAARFWDAQIEHVERLVAEQVEDARTHGAIALNYTAVTRLEREGDRVTGALLLREDGRAVRVHARATINATGVWADATLGPLGEGRPPKVRLTKGVHAVVPRFTKEALLVKSASDGRTFFILPWGSHNILGTTDTDFDGDPAQAHADAADIQYLTSETKRYFPDAPVDRIEFTFAGVRALVNQPGLSESRVTRRHILYDHEEREGLKGLWTLQGGKITTSRSLAEAAVTAAARRLGLRQAARLRPTRATAYPRCPPGDWTAFMDAAVRRAIEAGVPDPHAAAFVRRWASGWQDVWSLAGAAGHEALGDSGHFACEVVAAMRWQQAVHLDDVLLRRTTIGLSARPMETAARAVALVMAGEAGWDAQRQAHEWDSYEAALAVWRVP
jgi:glycerol-3-phosphate dehydrogenase